MRTIVVRAENGALFSIKGDLFTGAFDAYNNPVFENDYNHGEILTEFGSTLPVMSKVEWCEDCMGFHTVMVDEMLKEIESVFDGSPVKIIKVLR